MSKALPALDFWDSSGHHLLDHDQHGRLVVTDEFLKIYLARPEILPPGDACIVERALYQKLARDPRAVVQSVEIRDIADRDARENWQHLVAFRDALLAAPTIEAAYLGLVRAAKVATPPLFLNQLVHVIARNMLDGERDPHIIRAAEMLFRAQRLTIKDGVLLLADEELVDGSNVVDHASPLVAIFGDAKARNLDVMTAENAASYFERSDAHDLVMDFRPGQPARTAFAVVIARWVKHLLGLDVKIVALGNVERADWSWFVGLDQEGTRIGNALWQGDEPPENGLDRIVALFSLTFDDAGDMLARVAGKPVYLILGMTPNRIIRLKPQNLATGLPLRDQNA
ncbi:MAG: DUF6352 family protein [Hyphomicrobiaceae bacterium]